MRKFFSKGFFIGFLVTLVFGLILYFVNLHLVLLQGIWELTIVNSVVFPVIGSPLVALLGGIIGNWLYNSWFSKNHSRVIGFLIGAGLFFILSFLTWLFKLLAGVVIAEYFPIYLPGVVSYFLFPESGEIWTIIIPSLIFWGFVGWTVGFLWGKIRKTA